MDEKRSLGDFSRMKVDILKEFLRKRGLKATGRKDELVALAYSAEQLGLPLLKTDKDVTFTKAVEYQLLLSPMDGIHLPDPLNDLCEGWKAEKEGITSWPPIFQVDITQYLLALGDREISCRIMSDYKVITRSNSS